jgi:hypothetical protein
MPPKKEIDMDRIRVPERTATAAELAEDRRRCLAAKANQPTRAPIEGNLCACLVTFAAWRPCNGCGARVLFVNEQARTTGKFTCGRCDERREALTMQARAYPHLENEPRDPLYLLAMRAALHLRALFSTANDNGEART